MRLVYMGRNDGFVSRQMLGCELLGDLMCQLRRDLVRLERLDDVVALPSGDLAKGALCVHHMLAELDMEEDDLQFAMTAYGLCVLLETHGEIEKADALREKLLARDGFWFCFSYLAAYSDYNYTVKPATVT